MKNRLIKLLLVEEDESSFLLLRDALCKDEEHSVDLERVTDGPQALRALQRRNYDVCVLTCDQSTLEFLHQLIEEDCAPPITILTGWPAGSEEEKKQSEQAAQADQRHFVQHAIRAALLHSDEMQRLQRDEMRFWAKFLEDSVATALLDSQGRICVCNGAFKEMFAYKEDVKARLQDMIHPDDASTNEQLLKNLLEGKIPQFQADSRYLRKDGSCIPVRQTAIGLIDSEKSSRSFVLLSLEVLSDSSPEIHKEGFLPKGALAGQPEQEKKLIAQELHDGLGGFLAAIKYSLEKNLDQLQKEKEGAETLLNEAIPLVQSAIEETRRISTSLWPSVIDDLGVIASITSVCSDFEKTYTNIKVEKQVDVLEQDIAPPLKIAIYRILQEALHNVARHSKADKVRLCLSKRNDRIELLIEDNGCGFDLAGKNKNTLGGMGLLSMRNRAEVCGGSLSVENAAEGGALVRFVCPAQ